MRFFNSLLIEQHPRAQFIRHSQTLILIIFIIALAHQNAFAAGELLFGPQGTSSASFDTAKCRYERCLSALNGAISNIANDNTYQSAISQSGIYISEAIGLQTIMELRMLKAIYIATTMTPASPSGSIAEKALRAANNAGIAECAGLILALDDSPPSGLLDKALQILRQPSTYFSDISTVCLSYTVTYNENPATVLWNEARFLMDLVLATSLMKDHLTTQEIANLEQNWIQPIHDHLKDLIGSCRSFSDMSALYKNNIGVRAYSACAAAELYLGSISQATLDELNSYIKYQTFYVYGVGAGWAEGPGYIVDAMSMHLPCRLMFAINGEQQYFGSTSSAIAALTSWVCNISGPQGQMPEFDDTPKDAYVPFLLFYRYVRNENYRYFYQKFESNLNYYSPDPTFEYLPTVEWPVAAFSFYQHSCTPVGTNPPDIKIRALPSPVRTNGNHLGIVTFHGPSVYLAISAESGPMETNGQGHDQQDGNSIILAAGNNKLLIDPAYPGWVKRGLVACSDIHSNLFLEKFTDPAPGKTINVLNECGGTSANGGWFGQYAGSAPVTVEDTYQPDASSPYFFYKGRLQLGSAPWTGVSLPGTRCYLNCFLCPDALILLHDLKWTSTGGGMVDPNAFFQLNLGSNGNAVASKNANSINAQWSVGGTNARSSTCSLLHPDLALLPIRRMDDNGDGVSDHDVLEIRGPAIGGRILPFFSDIYATAINWTGSNTAVQTLSAGTNPAFKATIGANTYLGIVGDGNQYNVVADGSNIRFDAQLLILRKTSNVLTGILCCQGKLVVVDSKTYLNSATSGTVFLDLTQPAVGINRHHIFQNLLR